MKQSHSCRHSATLPSLAADHVRSGRSLAGMGFLDAEIMQKQHRGRVMRECIFPEWRVCEAVTLVQALCHTAKLGS